MKPGPELFSVVDEFPVHAERPQVEIHDGVHLERRAVLGLGALGGAWGLALPVRRAGRRASSGALAFPDFLDEVFRLAEEAVGAKQQHEDSYLWSVASLMTRVGGVPDVEAKAFGDLEGLAVGRHERRMPISVLELRLEPHAAIPLHNHNGYAGNLVGLEGEVRIASYDPVESDASFEEPFLLRQTGDVLMTAGRVATLSTTRDNFHALVAGPEGARALDVFTFFANPGPSGYYEVGEAPVDDDRRVFEATPAR